jgi:hypothetical protein
MLDNFNLLTRYYRTTRRRILIRGWRLAMALLDPAHSQCLCLDPDYLHCSYAPRLLANRAKKLRKETGDSKYVTEQDLDTRPFSQRLTLFLLRPFQLLFQELIVFFISLYMSVLYGLLYMFFVAFPIIYQQGKVRDPRYRSANMTC